MEPTYSWGTALEAAAWRQEGPQGRAAWRAWANAAQLCSGRQASALGPGCLTAAPGQDLAHAGPARGAAGPPLSRGCGEDRRWVASRCEALQARRQPSASLCARETRARGSARLPAASVG